VQPLAFEGELEVALGEALLRRHGAFGHPVAAVPELDRAATILPFGDGALEVAIVERMILDLHREPPVVGIERWSLGDRPGLEHAVELKPEVVMQPPRVVLLDDEAPALGRNDPVVATGLGGLGEVPFSPVFRELALVEHEVHRTLRTRG
jgi:hypothetical protein